MPNDVLATVLSFPSRNDGPSLSVVHRTIKAQVVIYSCAEGSKPAHPIDSEKESQRRFVLGESELEGSSSSALVAVLDLCLVRRTVNIVIV